ncbi:MAG: hypothetical protein KJ621_15920 [Proteobacteria bacterium]|nr:hypothetical protein [Pseudomonadota bacterium]
MWAAVGPGVTLCTRDGDVLFGEGHLAGGTGDQAAGQLLARQRQLRDLKQAIEDKQARVDRLAAELEAAARARNEHQEVIDRLGPEKERLDEELQEAEREFFHGQQTLALLTTKVEDQNAAQAELSDRIESLSRELAGLEEHSRHDAAQARELAARIDRRKQDLGARKAAVEALRQQVTDYQVKQSALRHRQASLNADLERISQEQRDLSGRLEILEQDVARAREQQQTLTARREEHQTRVAGLYDELEAKQRLLRGSEEGQRQVEEELLALEVEIKDQHRALSGLRERLTELRLERNGLEIEQKTQAEKASEKYGQDLARVAGDYLQEDLDLGETRGQLDKLTGRIERMAEKINLSAIEEHQVLEERHQFLTGHRDDLIRAVEDLNQTIRRINRTSKARFIETLEQVNVKLQEVFPLLFEGGQAELFLIDPQNPLESGLDVHFQPPGKKLKTMSLMSGGEKALTAVAVAFSLFLIRPAPFCLLDEVDAPLDEANLERFNHLVQRLGRNAQVILASHKRGTMEAADTLYGVTMDEPGVTRVLSLKLKEEGAEPMAA